MSSPINYNNIISLKKDFKPNDNIIEILTKVALNITEISNRIMFTTSKNKTYTKGDDIPPENRIISLLNLLTESNKTNIFHKILDLDLDKLVLEKCITNMHKKVCLEYHFFENYIYLIKQIVSSGHYNFNNNLFWKLFIKKTQDIFETITDIENCDNALFSGNLILIFYLCRDKLLSLKVLTFIFNSIKKDIETDNTLINILFSTLDLIPLHDNYNNILLTHINIFLELNIPFRLKFKLEELKLSITKIVSKSISKSPSNLGNFRSTRGSKVKSNVNSDDKIKSNKLTELSNRNKENIKLDNLILSFIVDFKTNNCYKTLEKNISTIKNFRKSYFFKLFILNLIKTDIVDAQFTSLIKFIYTRKYRPNNFKNILSQITKTIKKFNNDEYNNKLSIILLRKN
jgi:hypothetical protein